MSEIKKPASLSNVWAAAGDRIRPSDEKIMQGWVVEIPMMQNENWITNRQDMAIAHINQHGLAVWDSNTMYIDGKSYVQGIDGYIYKAVVDNVNVEPGTDDNVWQSAFVTPDDVNSLRVFNGYIVISSGLNAQSNKRYYALNSLTITLPSSAATGDNVIINKMPSAEVTIDVDGSGVISTIQGDFDNVKYDIADEINITYNGSVWVVA